MERKNELGLDGDDLTNVDVVLEGLMDVIAAMNANEYTEEHFADLKEAIDYGQFIVSGIIYKNGMDLCAGHEHDDDDD